MSTQEQATEQACPECGSDQVAIKPYDFGTCLETGYHDAGERYCCDACGAQGDVDDMQGALISEPNAEVPPPGAAQAARGSFLVPVRPAGAAGWNTAQFA